MTADPARDTLFARGPALRAFLSALALALVSAWHEPVCSADPPSDEAAMEQRRAEAKLKYQDGAAAYTAARYKDAVESFLAADHLAPSAPLSFNIARAYEKLGDDAGTLRWYRDYLRRNPTAANAETVRGQIALLAHALQNRGVQQITLLTSPTDATVSIDDEPVGVSPWTGEIKPGRHHVLISLRGYGDEQLEVSLAVDEPLTETVRLSERATVAEPTPANPASTARRGRTNEANARGEKKLGVIPWLTVGAGAAALGGSLTFEILRRNAESSARRETTQLGYQDRLSTEQSRQTVARVLLGAGGTLLAAGAVMLLIDTGTPHPSTSAGLLCLPGACGVTARGSF
jgi:tetratricopeptide (TPR) repeat protein